MTVIPLWYILDATPMVSGLRAPEWVSAPDFAESPAIPERDCLRDPTELLIRPISIYDRLKIPP